MRMPFWNQGRDGATAVFWQAHALPPDHPDVLAEFQTGNAPRDGPNPTAPPHHLQALRIAFPRLLGFACTYRSHPPSKSGHNAEIAPQVTQAQIVKRTTWGLHRAYTGPTPGLHRDATICPRGTRPTVGRVVASEVLQLQRVTR